MIIGFPNEHPAMAIAFCGKSYNASTKSCQAGADVKVHSDYLRIPLPLTQCVDS